jgi:hypothetical protein
MNSNYLKANNMNTGEAHFEEITDKIINELETAESEIKVAMAWFTDRDLFGLLLEKAKLGVHIDLILAEKEDNKRLPFDQLEDQGAEITWIRGESFGMMHQKFCIIDKKTLINGSFNWTVNASKNNQENIVITKENPILINKFLEQFDIIKSQIQILNHKEPALVSLNQKPAITQEKDKANEVETDDWGGDLFINSSVGDSDKDVIQERGFKVAKENNGNAGVIPKHLDTVYHDLLNDTHVNEEKKVEMRATISKRASNLIENAKLEQQRQNAYLEEEALADEKNHVWEAGTVEAEIEAKESQKRNVLENVIPRIKEKITALKEKVEQVEMDALIPAIKWHKVGPLAFATLFLTLYLLLFYASTFYTILNATADAQTALESGSLPLGEVFNAEAIRLAWEKGFSTLMIIMLFTSIPLACGMTIHYGNKISRASAFIAVLLLDVLIAYKIAEVIFDARYLAGKTDEDWVGLNVFWDPNFYFVLMLGFVAFIIWGFLLDLLLTEIDRRHPNSVGEKKIKEKTLLGQKIEDHYSEIDSNNEEATSLHLEIIELKHKLKDLNRKINFIPAELQKKVGFAITALEAKEKAIENKQHEYLNYLNRDQIPVSINALQDRTAAFIAGWDRYLHDQFSSHRATDMSIKAHAVVDTWLSQRSENLQNQNANIR